MMVQSPLRELVDPRDAVPLCPIDDQSRRRAHRYPRQMPGLIRIDQAVHDVQLMDVSFGGVCVLAPVEVRPKAGASAQLITRTASGVYGDNLEVVDSEQKPHGTVIRLKVAET